MKKPLIVLLIGCVFIILSSVLIYPTLYHYQVISKWNNVGTQIDVSIRTNNLTGSVEKYDEERGWVSDYD